jgi:hypothetical protein
MITLESLTMMVEVNDMKGQRQAVNINGRARRHRGRSWRRLGGIGVEG